MHHLHRLGRKKNGRAGQSNDETPSRVGEMLAEQISRRVVILVLLVVLVTPFLEVGIDYYTPNENLMLSMEKMQVSERELFIDEVIRKKETPVVYLVVLGKVYQEKPDGEFCHPLNPISRSSLPYYDATAPNLRPQGRVSAGRAREVPRTRRQH